MDILISIVDVSEENFKKYVAAIRDSNMEKFIKGKLIDILNTARTQTEQAKDMGWL